MDNRKQPSTADHERLQRIHEEVAERLYEAATITARTLGYKGEVLAASTDRAEATPHAPEKMRKRQTRKAHKHFEERVVIGNRLYIVTNEGACGYYDFEEEMCVEAPCL